MPPRSLYRAPGSGWRRDRSALTLQHQFSLGAQCLLSLAPNNMPTELIALFGTEFLTGIPRDVSQFEAPWYALARIAECHEKLARAERP